MTWQIESWNWMTHNLLLTPFLVLIVIIIIFKYFSIISASMMELVINHSSAGRLQGCWGQLTQAGRLLHRSEIIPDITIKTSKGLLETSVWVTRFSAQNPARRFRAGFSKLPLRSFFSQKGRRPFKMVSRKLRPRAFHWVEARKSMKIFLAQTFRPEAYSGDFY